MCPHLLEAYGMKFTFSSGICQLGFEDKARNGVIKLWGEAILIKYSGSLCGNLPTVRCKTQGARDYSIAEWGILNADRQCHLEEMRSGMMQNTPSIT